MTKRHSHKKKKLPASPVTVTIEKLNHEGRGIARIDNKATFIFNALAGETVEFNYNHCHNHYDEGTATTILSASPLRTSPQCLHFGVCGGCSLQHMQHAAQVQHKQMVFLELLAQVNAKPEVLLSPLSSSAWGYRHKARLGVRYVTKKDAILVGFRERQSNFLTLTTQCPILHPSIGEKIEVLTSMISQLTAYQEIAQIEVAIGDNATALIFRHLVDLTTADQQRLIAFGQQHNIWIYLQSSGPASVHKLWPTDPQDLYYTLPAFDLRLQFHPLDFTQVNPYMNHCMVQQAIDLLDPQPNEQILDLFCGLGNFSLPLATRSQRVIGIEGSTEMTERAYANAQLNQLANIEFYAANLMDELHAHAWAKETYDKILLDPPRSGAQDIVAQIDRWQAKRIVYVSCNPATLARDTKILLTKGYQLTHAGIMDMFPHTDHVESMAVFAAK